MTLLFERLLLQEGHMGNCLSSAFPPWFPAGVDSEEREPDAAKENCTGLNDFRLHIGHKSTISFEA